MSPASATRTGASAPARPDQEAYDSTVREDLVASLYPTARYLETAITAWTASEDVPADQVPFVNGHLSDELGFRAGRTVTVTHPTPWSFQINERVTGCALTLTFTPSAEPGSGPEPFTANDVVCP